MRIQEVRYSRLVSFGNYENETIGITVESTTREESENPDSLMKTARDWVNAQILGRERSKELTEECQELEYRAQSLKRDIERFEEQWRRARAFLSEHGLGAELPEQPYYQNVGLENLPF